MNLCHKLLFSNPYIFAMQYHRFQIGFIFVEYELFNNTTFIQNCISMNFRITVSYKFLETGTSDRCFICIV